MNESIETLSEAIEWIDTEESSRYEEEEATEELNFDEVEH